MNKLDEICRTKRGEVQARKQRATIDDLDRAAKESAPPRGFMTALTSAQQTGFGLIAEIKKASPSKGLIRHDFHPADHARNYADGGAACLSVLTDEPYFQGSDTYLVEARQACDLPVLRKDFMIDPWQVAEARALGADAILVIIAALSSAQAEEIEAAAIERGMDVLVEVHDEAELEAAMHLRSRLIGVNNRDLKSFRTDLATTERLAERVPPDVLLVGESGIASHVDCQRLARKGVRSFLVGESLMRQDDLSRATRCLLEGNP